MYPTLPHYSQLTAPKRRMVGLKEQGLTHAQIADAIVSEFNGATTTKNTVDDLFREGSVCRKALREWQEYLADQAVIEAKQLIRSTYKDSVAVLVELSKPPHKPSIRIKAARSLAQSLLSTKELTRVQSDTPTYSVIIDAEMEAILRSTMNEQEAAPG